MVFIFNRQPLLDELAACESHGEDQQGLGNSRLTGSPAGGKGPKQKVTPGKDGGGRRLRICQEGSHIPPLPWK